MSLPLYAGSPENRSLSGGAVHLSFQPPYDNSFSLSSESQQTLQHVFTRLNVSTPYLI